MVEFLGKKINPRNAAGVVAASLALGGGLGAISNASDSVERPPAATAAPAPKRTEAPTSSISDPIYNTIPESTTTIDMKAAADKAKAQLDISTTSVAPQEVVVAPPTTAEVRVGGPADPNNTNGSIERDGPVDRESVMRAADEFKNMIIDDVTNKRGTDGGSQNLDQVDEQTGDRTVIFVSNFTNEDGTTGFYQNRAVIGSDGVTKTVAVAAYMGSEQSGDDPVLAAQLSLDGENASYEGPGGVGRNLNTNSTFTDGYANGRALAEAARAAQPLQSVVLRPIV